MEVIMDPELARKAISLVDLTDLNDGCTPEAIDALCERASRYGTAAVCVWPDFVAQSSRLLAGTGVRVATVVNFPTGDERPFAVALVTERALVDGADEIDADLNLIKGGGGALLREKIVATASARMVVIADEGKLVKTLGKFPLPVEVVRFGLLATIRLIKALGAQAGCEGEIKLRTAQGDAPFITDQGNLIVDCAFGAIPEPEVLAFALSRVPGVIEHGMFLGLADLAIVAGSGGVKTLRRPGV